ncbi:trimeric intracellular cation channel family protein [Candidimonas sp. SYP-B2681]|uniref:trimeric intracellular cation channel family protein n=1 Tax=Candidimonas sp. SYP-B2681 TaxID=2497686 RepID=UPI000F87402C|nr:trimeric intracellular cation channel family protein [Candidimonas sp. SYP-B2681]RTZ42584.1 trimeric intracellular cation channel family protein [Candidimonas sp. SYP-B2681]
MLSAHSAALLHVLFVVAIVAEAMTAAVSAGRRSMDWVGVCLLGCVTALGGGSARDILLGHYPLTWVQNPYYLLITVAAAFTTILTARLMHHLRRLFLFLDAVGLVVFTVIGCNVAMEMGLPLVVVAASGLITGCVGGVLRDILCNDIPLLFQSELYATVSMVTAAIYVGGLRAEMGHDLIMGIAMVAGLTLRLLALRFSWGMPKFVYTRDEH